MKHFSLFVIVYLCVGGTCPAEPASRAALALTPVSARQILGGPVVETGSPDRFSGKNWESGTTYTNAGASSSVSTISLTLRHRNKKAEALNIFYLTKATFRGREVPGLGYPAYRTQMPAQLNVLKGSNLLVISAGTAKIPDLDKQFKVAKAALPLVSDR